ncbi:retrovirus-related pol polyprotein from transposon TNT 1-94 [Tanacetum coccineum]
MKVKESLNVTFDESPSPTKISPLVDDDVGEEEAIKKNTKVVNNNNEDDESIEVDKIVNIKESKNHPLDQVIGNLNQRTLRSQSQNHSNFFCFISTIEPKDVKEALKDESWVVAMKEELNQFVANDVWELVPLPISQLVIGTKWVFRNKLDENGIVSRNKARLVAQGYNQQEGIDYDETYALSIKMGMVDNTLFTKKSKSHLIIVQIYVDDIIFGSTSQNLCDDFAKIMHDESEMSMMGELNFFLGLQIKQMEDEIFFNQSKYIKEMLKKFGLEDSKPTKTSMSTEIKLTKDDDADSVDSSKYRENPKTAHLEAVKRIFRVSNLMGKLLKEVLMIDELSIVEMDMLKLVVEFECFGKCVDEFDKVTVLFGEMQLKQEDRSYVHASNELHLHVVPSKHEADQHW